MSYTYLHVKRTGPRCPTRISTSVKRTGRHCPTRISTSVKRTGRHCPTRISASVKRTGWGGGGGVHCCHTRHVSIKDGGVGGGHCCLTLHVSQKDGWGALLSQSPRQSKGRGVAGWAGTPMSTHVVLSTGIILCGSLLLLQLMLNVLGCRLTYHHVRDKLRPMREHGSILLYDHGNQKAR